jgi:hypothetical protein
MLRSGTIKTLGALVAAMSVGTLVLLWMETIPAQPRVPLPLQAVRNARAEPGLGIIHQTDVPLQYIRWRNVVVHDAGADGPAVAGRCHFLIGSAEEHGDGTVISTRLWRRQRPGRHIYVPGYAFENESIGVCLLNDYGQAGPSRRQLAALVQLLRGLQVTCQIPPDRVYLHSELGKPGCPGEHFPAEALRGRLIPATR